MKVVSEIDVGAAVCSEPASHEYLNVPLENLGPEPRLQDKKRVVEVSDKSQATARIRKIHTPLLIMGRDTDHLQGIFQVCYDWMKEAGKEVEWVSYNHPAHGFIFPGRRPGGAYQPDDIQRTAIDGMLAFFGRHMKK